MITIENYFELIETNTILRNKLSNTLQKGWDYVNQVTKNGDNIEVYQASDIIKRTIDLYFEKLESFLKNKKVTQSKIITPTVKNKPVATPKKIDAPVNKRVRRASITNRSNQKIELVEKISDEIKYVKRYLNLHEKAKSKNQIRLFLASIQKAIIEKRIRKASKYAREIQIIQNSLIDLMDNFQSSKIIEVHIPQKRRASFLKLVGKQLELQSVKFIKTYINLQGKPLPTTKAKNLHNKIARKVNANTLNSKDKYWKEIQLILTQLKSFIKVNPIGGELKIESKTLNGLEGIVLGKVKHTLDEFAQIPSNTIMNSMDIVKLNFKKLGFKGRWLNFIGNPSKGFSVMVYGKPKMGKSYLSVDFAGYLARNHGTVLYVAREEGIDDTLQDKLKDTKVAHPDLDVADYLPEDLTKYDFIFLDSVTKLALSPEDLENLKRQYPEKSFVYIFQVTKGGVFRGNNEFQHDVDVVIEIPEKGKAIQFGRFNQGGEMDIFS